MTDDQFSIYREYYSTRPFIDRYTTDRDRAIDVLVPVIHTNELWRANLLSFYREIPIRNLLIGDGGCTDNSLDIAREFPRVKVLDHRSYKSLGYSIRKLIEAVEADWFAYIHSDVFLPPGWFDAMARHQQEFDWFGCPMRHTIMVEYTQDYGSRPWAGAQLGRRAAFGEALSRIDDDYVYRQEDFVFSDVVRRTGGTEGKVDETFHYHQTMRKDSPSGRKVIGVHVEMEMKPAEEIRTWDMQARGVVKYLLPDDPWVRDEAVVSVEKLIELRQSTWSEFAEWVRTTNPAWLPYLDREIRKRRQRRRLKDYARSAWRLIAG